MILTGNPRLAAAWLFVTGLCGYFEYQRFSDAVQSPAGALAWLTFWEPETTLPFLILVALPLLCLIFGSSCTNAQHDVQHAGARRCRWLSWLAVTGVSLAASVWVGLQPVNVQTGLVTESVSFCDLPPTYHDEYSYLLQAETFAAGRLSWPPAPVRPDLFHQFHVLNEHRTASRYFPWTGLWTSLFLQTGRPIIGHWLAGALAAGFFYLAASEVLRPQAALTAGLLIGCSPGLALFSNMLLAHHPTLLALSVFLWTMIRLIRYPTMTLTLICGISLSLAMLGRPMTAAGFALPWGLVFGWRIVWSTESQWSSQRFQLLACMAVPLTVGFVGLGVLNQETTGSFFRSPYQEYTETYTPRHVYGFNNGIRGEANQTPKVLKSYDQWADNLTWSVAVRNTGHRCLASAQWTLGIAPIVMGLTLVLLRVCLPSQDQFHQTIVLWLMIASVLTLHLVHVPYWFSGIMHWHYVFETAPLILTLAAAGFSLLTREISQGVPHRVRRFWLISFLLAALLPGWLTAEAMWGPSKISSATSELAWSRRQFEKFNRMVNLPAVTKPAIVLVDETASDPQLSYIINDPEYQNDVLVARLPGTPDEINELQDSFPDRTFYRFDPRSVTLTPIKPE
ncbi:MAG: glycosyltransferase family 39 protein [Fuerstiella sp.]|nr:glycosyltransferase family 39 protein [Fuerstiella sp.]